MGSSRLEGKPLLQAGGKSLIRHIYDKAQQVPGSSCIVATSCTKIYDYCQEAGIRCGMTEKAATGTHRVAEAIQQFSSGTLATIESVINWQVDEPDVDPKWVERLFDLLSTGQVDIGTLVARLDEKDHHNPNVVKAIMGTSVCEWFTRNYVEGAKAHIGIYGYTIGTLFKLGVLEPTILSRENGLEQLAWRQWGDKIHAIEVERTPISINSREDWKVFSEKIAAQV